MLFTRMVVEKVPPHVGIKMTGHKFIGAYERYDEPMLAKVRATTLAIGGATMKKI